MADAVRVLAKRRQEGCFFHPLTVDCLDLLKRIEPAQLTVLPGKGLAHDHVTIADTDLLLRIPKQSQMQLSAQENLFYQASCFERLQPSLHTPICYASIPPSPGLPMGALLVQRIKGRHAETAADFQLIARALASIHRLPTASSDARAPLLDQKNPMSETLAEIETQSAYLAKADLDSKSMRMIESELRLAHEDVVRLPIAPASLICFDAHPGNFVFDATGKAILVDLEKARYSGSGLDLAHATLYTSTTWDADINIRLSVEEVCAFYTTWSTEVGECLSSRAQAYLLPMRRLMWLWSVTWCAKWRVQCRLTALRNKHVANNTEDWAAENNPEQLVLHVDERVNHYLQSEVISNILQEFRR